MTIKKEFGKQIKNLRVNNGYTQEKLAELLNISQRALSSIELGNNFVSAETIENLLNVFDITLEDLFATNSFKESNELLKWLIKTYLKLEITLKSLK